MKHWLCESVQVISSLSLGSPSVDTAMVILVQLFKRDEVYIMLTFWVSSVCFLPPPSQPSLPLVLTAYCLELITLLTSYEGCQVFDCESTWLSESNFFNIQIFVNKGKRHLGWLCPMKKEEKTDMSALHPGIVRKAAVHYYYRGWSPLIKHCLAE